MKKRILNFEAECDHCDKVTWFTEDLDQVPTPIGGYDMVWADCTVCGFGVQYYGSNAE